MRSFLLLPTTCLFLLCRQATAIPILQTRTSFTNKKAGMGKSLGTVALHVHGNTLHDHHWPGTSASKTVRRARVPAEHQECDFDSIQEFFEYAYKENLNITAEVQSCQNLCLLTYGTGNPDLSGIGVSSMSFLLFPILIMPQMMHAYNVQIALTILFGPVFRLLQIGISRYDKAPEPDGISLYTFVTALQPIQTVIFASNGFFILSSAVASLVRLNQPSAIFEVAEMQALAFLQLNSLLVSFFCLARPIYRLVARVFFTTIVFICVVVVLAKSQLSSTKRMNWRLASEGCEHGTSDYGVITPIPYPPSAVIVFAIAGILGLCLRSIKAKFQGNKRNRVLFNFLMGLWVMLIGLMTVGMLFGLAMVWRQREHLRVVVGDKYEDDVWGFGQVAALFIWAPIPVEIFHILNGQFSHLRFARSYTELCRFYSAEISQTESTDERGNHGSLPLEKQQQGVSNHSCCANCYGTDTREGSDCICRQYCYDTNKSRNLTTRLEIML